MDKMQCRARRRAVIAFARYCAVVLATCLLAATHSSPAQAQGYVPSGSIFPQVWSPQIGAYVTGQPKGYAEDETTAHTVIIRDQGGQHYILDICVQVYELQIGIPHYGFSQFDSWNRSYELSYLPTENGGQGPTIDYGDGSWDRDHGTVWGKDLEVNSVTGPTKGQAQCNDTYDMGYTVDFTVDSGASSAWITVGGRLAFQGNTIAASGFPDATVPAGMGASTMSGTFQTEFGGTGAKTINYKGTDIQGPAEITVTTGCPDFYAPTFTYTTLVTNNGPSSAPGLVLTDTFNDSRFTFSGYTTSRSGTCSDSGSPAVITCTLADALPGYATWTVVVTIALAPGTPFGTNFEHLVEVTSDAPDPVVTNNDDSCVSTTPITLASFQARRVGTAVRIDWSTSSEVGNVGYDLYVVEDGRHRLLTPVPIAAADGGVLEPREYAYVAIGVRGDRFYLQDIALDGARRLHGPFDLGTDYGSRLTGDPIPWPAIRAEVTANAGLRTSADTVAAQARVEGLRTNPVGDANRTEGGASLTEGNPSRTMGAAGHTAMPGTDAGMDVRPGTDGVAAAAAGSPTLLGLRPGGRTDGPSQNLPPEDYLRDLLRRNLAQIDTHVADLLVRRDGLYRVTYEALRDRGLDLSGTSANQIALVAFGEPVPVRLIGANRFGPGSVIEFYGRALDTLYTDVNVYRLHLDSRLARRVLIDRTPQRTVAIPASDYVDQVTIEQNRTYDVASRADDPWAMARFTAIGRPVSGSVTFDVQDCAPGPLTNRVKVELVGVTDWPGGPDHHARVAVNGVDVGDTWFDGPTLTTIDLGLPPGLLREGPNVLTLTVPGDTGFLWDVVSLERFTVTYPRRFLAHDGRLAFDATGEVFRVDGLPSPNVVVYRVTPNRTEVVPSVTTVAGGGLFGTRFVGSNAVAHYEVTSVETLAAPEIVPARTHAAIVGGEAQLVVIAHPGFIEGVRPLVAVRQAQGLSARIVDVTDVYDQFGHGVFDATAIREYIRYAVANMGTAYVLLVGGDTYDYRNYLGGGSISFVPSLYAATDGLIRFAPVDPLLADTDDDGVPNVAIGRLPVYTAADLTAIVEKTLAYAAKTYASTAVLAADGEDGGLSFTDYSEAIAETFPADWVIERAYLDRTSLAAARSTLIGAMNRGVSLVTYVGHSDMTRWTFDGLFSRTDAAALANDGRPTVVTQWGCWNTYYPHPARTAMAHKLLLSGDRGAAAVLGSTTLSEADSEAALAERMMPLLVRPGVKIGDAMLLAKADLARTVPGATDVILGWTLLGDPTLAVAP